MKKFRLLSAGFLLFLCLMAAMTVYADAEKTVGKPELVSVTATGFDSAKITWKKAENAVYYAVYYKIDGKWLRVGKTQATTFEHKSSAKRPLVPGKTYIYTVKAFITEDVFGDYEKNGMQVKLPKPKVGKVTGIKTKCEDYNRMTITWEPTTDAVLYRVYIKSGNDWIKLGSTKSTSFTVKKSAKAPMETGVSYYYTVRAEATYGGKTFRGEYNKKGVKGKVRPQTPVLESVKQTGSDRVTIKWKSSFGATKYIVYYKQAGGSWKKLTEVGKDKTEYVHVKSASFPLNEKGTYSYTVRAYSSKGDIHSWRDEKGLSVVVQSAVFLIDEKVHRQAQVVIGRLTKPTMTQSQKLNACFTWVMGSHYKPNSNPNYNQANWQYYCAYDYLLTHTGSCHGFAFGFAALARELGYQPYVICIPHVHSIVRINGGYWDNMYGGQRGVSTTHLKYSQSNVFKFF